MIYESFAQFFGKIYCFSSYVNTANGFPKPLTPEEETEYLQKIKQGDKEARDIIIRHNLRLVVHIVKKFNGSMEAEDMLSVGTIGLIKAVDSYDCSKGIKLSTYASRCIQNEILMYIRANKKHRDVVSLSSLCKSSNNDSDVELEGVIQNEDYDMVEEVEQTFLIERIKQTTLDKLSKKEREIITKRYGLNGGDIKTQTEVADEVGISRSYVSRIEKKALQTIRDEIEN